MSLTRRVIGASVAAVTMAGLTLAAVATPAQAASNSYNFEGYSAGPVNGQHGWSIGTTPYDAAFVDNTSSAPASFGNQSLRISNSVTTGGFDQVYSPELTNEAGEPGSENGGVVSGARKPQFVSEFSVASLSGTGVNGGTVTVSPTGKGGDRMSFVKLSYATDGLHISTSDVDGTGGSVGCDCAEFVSHDLGTFAANKAHKVRVEIRFLPGASNDVVTVFVDGVKEFTGTSWEDYYRFDTESGTSGKSRAIDRLLFRPQSDNAAPTGTGMLFDNITYSSGAITAYKDQAITFAQPSGVSYGAADVPLGATASSGLAVSYSSATPDVCTIKSGKAHIIGGGTCAIAADQAGNAAVYVAAPTVTRSFTVSPAHVAITTDATSILGFLLGGRVTFSSVVKNADFGTPIKGASVAITVDGTVRCTAVTNASGVATCSTSKSSIVFAHGIQTPFTASTAATANYLAGFGAGLITLL